MLGKLKSIDFTNRKTQYILGGIALVVVIGIFIMKMGVFEPKEISIGKESKTNSERIWFVGDLENSDVPQITNSTEITKAYIVKDGKKTEYAFTSNVGEISGKSDSEIKNMVKKYDDKYYSSSIKSQKETIKEAKKEVSQLNDEAQKTFAKYGTLKEAYTRLDAAIDSKLKGFNGDSQDLEALKYRKEHLEKAYKGLESGRHAYASTYAYDGNLDGNDDLVKKGNKVFTAQRRLNQAKGQVKVNKQILKTMEKNKNNSSKLEVTAVSTGGVVNTESIDGTSYDTVLNNSVDSTNYGGYGNQGSSEILFTKTANQDQKVVFDNSNDVNK